MESICSDAVFTAWGGLQDTMFAMWKDLSAIGYIFFGVLTILILINIVIAVSIFFSRPNNRVNDAQRR